MGKGRTLESYHESGRGCKFLLVFWEKCDYFDYVSFNTMTRIDITTIWKQIIVLRVEGRP